MAASKRSSPRPSSTAPPRVGKGGPKLDEQAILRRAPNLRVEIGTSSAIQILVRDRIVACGSHGLPVLDVFAQPISVAQAMERLRGRAAGMQDWLDLIATIGALHEAGVLEEPHRAAPLVESSGAHFSDVSAHIDMLNDRERTDSYLEAIQEVVRTGDVVVDLGTGSGILAMAAAKAGAAHVYAIEASEIAQSAESLFEANGLADRITIVRGWSTQVTLRERADLLVTEIIGSEPLEERALEAIRDALKRHLKRGTRVIPRKIRILAIPVSVPDRHFRQYRVTEGLLRKWRLWYGMNFRPLAETAGSLSLQFGVDGGTVRKWAALGDPILLAEMDFKRTTSLQLDRKVGVTAQASGLLSGLVI